MSEAAEDGLRRNRRDADRAAASDPPMELADRRRPGRKAADLALIPLLRRPMPDAEDSPAAQPGAADPSTAPGKAPPKPGRGVFVAVLLSLPFWSGVAVLVAWLRR